METEKHIKKLLLIGLLCIILIGCKKEEQVIEEKNIIIEGIIYDETEHIPLDSVKIELYGYEPVGSYFFNRIIIDSIVSDTNGFYRFKKNRTIIKRTESEQYTYEIETTYDNYFNGFEVIDNESLINNKTYKKDIYIKPKATLLIHFQNVFPHDSSDFFRLLFAPFQTGWTSGFCIDEEYGYHYGINVDDTSICNLAYGNRYNRIRWDVTKNSVSNTYMDSIFCVAFDTTIYNIYY